MSKGSALGDLAGIIGGPVVLAEERKVSTAGKVPEKPELEAVKPPTPVLDWGEHSDRITAILPVSLLAQLETRVASLRRKKKVSVSGYIEAAVRELLALGEHDIDALERHNIKARRSVSRVP